jgi:hypothetical protein
MRMRIKTTLEKMSPNSAVNVAISQPREVNDTPTCDRPHLVDCSRAGDIQTQVLNTAKAQRMAEFFSLLGDANRLRLLSVLAKQELCVCDLAAGVEDERISSIAPVAGIAGDAVGKLPQGWETSFL